MLHGISPSGGGSIIAEYIYNPDGSRHYKRSHGLSGDQLRFYHVGDQEILETANNAGWTLQNNEVLRRYVRLPGSVDEASVMIDYTINASCTVSNDQACEIYVHQNRLGSVIATSDSNGNVQDKYTYSPYGVSGSTNTGFPFRFTGQRLDAETGLMYYKTRYYAPETGRFLQTDPIGYKDNQNLYTYVGNDPTNFSDPSGMARCGRTARSVCASVKERAHQARDKARAAAGELDSLATDVANGSVSEEGQSILNLIEDKFGAGATSAESLQKLAGNLNEIADTIGADGEGIVIERTHKSFRGARKTVATASTRRSWFGFGPKQNVVTLYQPYFSESGESSQISTFIHEGFHFNSSDLTPPDGGYHYSGGGGIKHLKETRPDYIFNYPDSHACWVSRAPSCGFPSND